MVHQMIADMEVSYLWGELPVAEHLKIARVYGFLMCPDTGYALVLERDGRSDLSGRHEAVDADPNFWHLDRRATPSACRRNPAGKVSPLDPS